MQILTPVNYIYKNSANLRIEASRGGGEHIDALAELMDTDSVMLVELINSLHDDKDLIDDLTRSQKGS